MAGVADDLLIALQGAARLGRPEALDAALSALDAWQPFVANARLPRQEVVGTLVPLGEALAAPGVPKTYVQEMAAHPLAGGRALAAAALGLRYLQGLPVDRRVLAGLGRDKRSEVRWALEEVLRRHGKKDRERLMALLEDWLDCAASPRLQTTALHGLLGLLPEGAQQVLALIQRCRSAAPPETQDALAEVLRAVAAAGRAEEVLSLLETWAAAEPTPLRAVVGALRGGWARRYRRRSLGVLDALEARLGAARPIRRVRKFLLQP